MSARCPACGSTVTTGRSACQVCGTTVVPTSLVPASPTQMASVTNLGVLVYQGGASAGQQIALTPNALTFGREADCDVVLNDNMVSRHHARLEWQGNTLMIRDLASSNGTHVNGQRIVQPRALQPGDQIRLGSTTFAFQVGANVAPARAPATVRVPMPSDPPVVEGIVREISAPEASRGSLAPLAIGAAGFLINPVAGIIGSAVGGAMAQRSQTPLRMIRLENPTTGKSKSVKLRGEPSGMISIGDFVQCWGAMPSGGTLEAETIFNQNTGEVITFKK